MPLGKKRSRRRRRTHRPLVQDWRDAELSRQDAQRIDEIHRSFEEKGWRLCVKRDGRSWVAWFYAPEIGPRTEDVMRGRTGLEAAQAAWTKLNTDQPLLGSSQPDE